MSYYASNDDVLNATGLDRPRIIEISTLTTETEVNTLITGFIRDAQEEMRGTNVLNIETMVRQEIHYCTGEDDVYQLGPEDEETYTYYDPTNCLIDVQNFYMGGLCPANRKLRPYPTDCELGTEDDSDWTGTTTIATSTTRKAGDVSISSIYANAAQFTRYPDITADSWIDKNIDIYEFMAFYVRSSVDNTTITVRLHDVDGNFNEASYEIVLKNHWYLVMWDLDQDFTSTVDWDDLPLMYIDYRVDTACTLLIDNVNINDEWMYTAPAGEVALMRRLSDEPKVKGYLFGVTYRYDPYLVDTPRNIKKACAMLAGIDLLDFMRGVRQTDTDFDVQSESGVPDYTRDSLTITRNDLEKKYKEAIKSTGYGFEFEVIHGE